MTDDDSGSLVTKAKKWVNCEFDRTRKGPGRETCKHVRLTHLKFKFLAG